MPLKRGDRVIEQLSPKGAGMPAELEELSILGSL